MARASRMGREIQLLTDNPPPGVAAYPVDGRFDKIMAQIQVTFTLMWDITITPGLWLVCGRVPAPGWLQGPKGTVYENGIFRIAIEIPER